MTKQDFMSISAVRSHEVQSIFSRAIDGEMTKIQFVDEFMAAPHLGRNHRKAKGAKNAMFHADKLEREFGWIWSEPKAKNEWQKQTAEWIERSKN